ncbi:hypothetical protein CN378_03315 [Bacillus sp. AFS015802]|uniref:hypothetical protein n=1 Tax=Bacillus sp. AFS015802 TaxID=2033486 RepID=UPI000BF84C09|nr:hypothetical protein [Bacillus sp. AFS015802]PFA69811.1 hypothetical protein CN378_03315 [Bacillus sp. AFS015802]
MKSKIITLFLLPVIGVYFIYKSKVLLDKLLQVDGVRTSLYLFTFEFTDELLIEDISVAALWLSIIGSALITFSCTWLLKYLRDNRF